MPPALAIATREGEDRHGLRERRGARIERGPEGERPNENISPSEGELGPTRRVADHPFSSCCGSEPPEAPNSAVAAVRSAEGSDGSSATHGLNVDKSGDPALPTGAMSKDLSPRQGLPDRRSPGRRTSWRARGVTSTRRIAFQAAAGSRGTASPVRWIPGRSRWWTSSGCCSGSFRESRV